MKENLSSVSKLSLVILGLTFVGILGSGILISYYAAIIERNWSHVAYAQSTDSIFGGSSTGSSSADNSKQDLVGNKKHSEKKLNSNEEQTVKSGHANRNIAPQARLSSFSTVAGDTSDDNNITSTITTKSKFTSTSTDNTKHVSIVGIKKDKSYDPDPIEINAGDSVTWTNDDNEIHTVTSGNQDESNAGQDYDSGTLASGQSFTHKFDKTGTYEYFCSFHDSMTGKVIVK